MQSVDIVEVAPRDGLQNEAQILPTEEKAELVGLLAGSGVRRIEVTSFVNPARVPQLADAEALCGLLPRGQVSWIGLVLNERGLDRAIRPASTRSTWSWWPPTRSASATRASRWTRRSRRGPGSRPGPAPPGCARP